MSVIKKKIWPNIFELVKSGQKRFEVRLADFAIKEGDILILEEWNPETEAYTGRTIQKKVDYVYHFHLNDFGQKKEIEKNGLYVIQIE
jgi:ASC-1-like (ASCH) protein